MFGPATKSQRVEDVVANGDSICCLGQRRFLCRIGSCGHADCELLKAS